MGAEWVEELLPDGSKHVLNTSFDSRGRFGRAMVDFQLPSGGTLCELLVAERRAVPYNGERKDPIRELYDRTGRCSSAREIVRPAERAKDILDHAVHCTKPLPVR